MRLLLVSLTVALLAACGSGNVGADPGTGPSEVTLDNPDGPIPHEWANPCKDFFTDLMSDGDAATVASRHGLDSDTAVPGSGEVAGYGCMAGSGSGLEAIVVHRRVGDETYSDYIIAEGGSTMDWAEWFEVTQPGTEIRPFEYGWTTEPPGVSEGLPTRAVWPIVAEGIESGAFDPSR